MRRLLVFAALALVGCRGTRPDSLDDEGLASFYASALHGRPTASGVPYDERQLTAAHRSLPFGTCVRVERRDVARAVEVRITDRGPYAGGRLIDVSRAAAEQLGMVRAGVVPVRLSACRRRP